LFSVSAYPCAALGVRESDVDRLIAGVALSEGRASVADAHPYAGERVRRPVLGAEITVDHVDDGPVELDHVDAPLARRQGVVDVASAAASDDERPTRRRDDEADALGTQPEGPPVGKRPAAPVLRDRREVAVVGDDAEVGTGRAIPDNPAERRPTVGRSIGVEGRGQVIERAGRAKAQGRRRHHGYADAGSPLAAGLRAENGGHAGDQAKRHQ
jgi:hypothetical protein